MPDAVQQQPQSLVFNGIPVQHQQQLSQQQNFPFGGLPQQQPPQNVTYGGLPPPPASSSMMMMMGAPAAAVAAAPGPWFSGNGANMMFPQGVSMAPAPFPFGGMSDMPIIPSILGGGGANGSGYSMMGAGPIFVTDPNLLQAGLMGALGQAPGPGMGGGMVPYGALPLMRGPAPWPGDSPWPGDCPWPGSGDCQWQGDLAWQGGVDPPPWGVLELPPWMNNPGQQFGQGGFPAGPGFPGGPSSLPPPPYFPEAMQAPPNGVGGMMGKKKTVVAPIVEEPPPAKEEAPPADPAPAAEEPPPAAEEAPPPAAEEATKEEDKLE